MTRSSRYTGILGPAVQPTSRGLEDSDYATVVSDMQTKQLTIEAAMRTSAQISRLSLFDYL